jgi:hypothetical protein
MEAQRNFNPEVGFVRRPGRKLVHNEFGLRFFQKQESRLSGWIREITPHVFATQALLPGGVTETKELYPMLRVGFQDEGYFQAEYLQHFERLARPFNIYRNISIPLGDYRFNEFALMYSSDNSAPVLGEFEYRDGDFYSGEKRTVVVGGRYRPNYHFSSRLTYEINNIDLPQGSFATHLAGLRVDYGFTAKAFLNTLFQYNSDANQISSNIRFRFIHRALSDFYIVYNEVRDRRRDRTDRELTLKYTHLLNF